jgi:hypothetical protein
MPGLGIPSRSGRTPGPAGPPWAALDRLQGAAARRPERPQRPTTPAGGTGVTGLTSSGLARRIPGANLPPGGLHTIRRGDPSAPQAAPVPQAAAPTPPPVTPSPVLRGPEAGDGVSHERAENVYTLLTSFADGVQRGLDESSAGPAGEGAPPT